MEELTTSRVKAQRPRPSYKSESEFYRNIAVGFAIFALVELVVIAYLARAYLAR